MNNRISMCRPDPIESVFRRPSHVRRCTSLSVAHSMSSYVRLRDQYCIHNGRHPKRSSARVPHGAIDELRRAVYREIHERRTKTARVLESAVGPATRRPVKARASTHHHCEPRAAARRFIEGADETGAEEQTVAHVKGRIYRKPKPLDFPRLGRRAGLRTPFRCERLGQGRHRRTQRSSIQHVPTYIHLSTRQAQLRTV